MPVQMPLKYRWARGFDHLPRKPVTVHDQPLNEEMFPDVHSELPPEEL